MSEELIPLSCNIFHQKDDHASRAVVALDIAMASIRRWLETQQGVNGDEGIARLQEIKATLCKMNVVKFDCRGELLAALDGRDTLPPREATPPTDPVSK